MSEPTKGQNKRELFIAHLISDPELCGHKAAENAGYAHPHVASARLMKRDDVQAAIRQAKSERAERMALSQDEVIEDLRELRDICMGRKPITKSVYTEGIPMDAEVKDWNPTGAKGALELLGKHLGMYTDRVEAHHYSHEDALDELDDGE